MDKAAEKRRLSEIVEKRYGELSIWGRLRANLNWASFIDSVVVADLQNRIAFWKTEAEDYKLELESERAASLEDRCKQQDQKLRNAEKELNKFAELCEAVELFFNADDELKHVRVNGERGEFEDERDYTHEYEHARSDFIEAREHLRKVFDELDLP